MALRDNVHMEFSLNSKSQLWMGNDRERFSDFLELKTLDIKNKN